MNLVLVLDDSAGVAEVLEYLVIQILAVGDNEEGIVIANSSLCFAYKEDHRVAFAAALSMPEDAELAMISLRDRLPSLFVVVQVAMPLSERGYSVVDAQILMILGDKFVQA